MTPLRHFFASTIDPPATDVGSKAIGPFTLLAPAITFATMALFCWLSMWLSHYSGGVTTIWLSNGLLFAIVIRRPRSLWPWLFLAGFVGNMTVVALYGRPLLQSAGYSATSSLEVVLSVVLLTRWFGHPFKLSQLRPLVGFLIIAVAIGPAFGGLLSTIWLHFFLPVAPFWQTTRTWYLGDCLGMAIIAPLVYILQQPGFFLILQPRHLPKTLLLLAVPSLVTLLVFSHGHDPMVFIIFPALLLVVFRLGFPGAVLSIFVVALISIALTVTGHGPLMLIPDGTTLHRIVVVQLFLAIALFTCFPVAALLEQRQSLKQSLRISEARYRELANTDSLTGQGNRRAFDERLIAEWQHSQAEIHQFAILSIDVDLFKTYNDIYGHLTGDACLQRIASSIADALLCCPAAKLFRMGGEEFAAVLPGCNAEEAFSTAELVRKAVLSAAIEHSGSPIGRQSVSIGVASTTSTSNVHVTSLLQLSDQALYRAKSLGRNRCEPADLMIFEDDIQVEDDLVPL